MHIYAKLKDGDNSYKTAVADCRRPASSLKGKALYSTRSYQSLHATRSPTLAALSHIMIMADQHPH